MGWRSDEIWLDTEVLWFGEASVRHAVSAALHAPAFFGLAPGAPAGSIPNGLAASRRRRAELRRRRDARKKRAAALVIGPAAMLTLAGPRLGGDPRARALREDPPSLTRFDLVESPNVPRSTGRPLDGKSTLSSEANHHRAIAGAASFPRVHWHRGTSHGLPYSGSLSGGTQLPPEGPDWVTWNPLEDRVPDAPLRLYGTEQTIRTIVSVLTAYRAANPDAPRVVVGDISLRGGGPMEEHRSHQNGLDVDLYYPRLDRALRAPVATDEIDRELAQDLLDRFVAAGAQMIFVGYATGLRGPTGIVIPYPNHENHMHVRFPPPPD